MAENWYNSFLYVMEDRGQAVFTDWLRVYGCAKLKKEEILKIAVALSEKCSNEELKECSAVLKVRG